MAEIGEWSCVMKLQEANWIGWGDSIHEARRDAVKRFFDRVADDADFRDQLIREGTIKVNCTYEGKAFETRR